MVTFFVRKSSTNELCLWQLLSPQGDTTEHNKYAVWLLSPSEREKKTNEKVSFDFRRKKAITKWGQRKSCAVVVHIWYAINNNKNIQVQPMLTERKKICKTFSILLGVNLMRTFVHPDSIRMKFKRACIRMRTLEMPLHAGKGMWIRFPVKMCKILGDCT